MRDTTIRYAVCTAPRRRSFTCHPNTTSDGSRPIGAADPSTVDTIEYAYLEGHEGVFTETKHGFEVDGLQVKCRHVFGAKAIDWRGLYKNPGA